MTLEWEVQDVACIKRESRESDIVKQESPCTIEQVAFHPELRCATVKVDIHVYPVSDDREHSE